MAEFSQTVVINRPVAQVFEFVRDLENDAAWSGRSAAEIRRTSSGPVGVGTTFRQRTRFLGRRLDLVLEVIDYQLNRSITLKTTSRQLSFTGTREVESVGDAATRVTFTGSGSAGGVWGFAEPLVAAVGRLRLRTQLAQLKRVLEVPALGDARDHQTYPNGG